MLHPLRKPLRFWMTGSLAVVMAALATGRLPLDDDERDEAETRRVVRHSPFGVDETAQRIEAAARQAGQGVIARVEGDSLVLVLSSSIGGTPVLMQDEAARPDVPLAVQVRGAAGGGADVLVASATQMLLASESMPARVAEELAALPGLVERALG